MYVFKQHLESLPPTTHRAMVLYLLAACLLRMGLEGLCDKLVAYAVRTERPKALAALRA